MKRYLYIAALACSGAVQAAPVTIDFEEFEIGTFTRSVESIIPPLQSKGFDITGYAYAFPYYPDPLRIGGDSLDKGLAGSASGIPQYDGYGSSVFFSLNRSDAGAFALYDFDFNTNNNGMTRVEGKLVGGGTVDLSTALGTGGWLNLESVSFWSEGSGQAYSYSYASGSLDNIVVSAVPIPAAVWLFASGLGILGWVRRRRR